ncbi:hypothetical protein P4O66_005734 [Electrophorus voltai]|uniref:Uncharacterized protein n=1 Tax=Electrophorus voltai TaxID=2609070 RepID=A0AAD8ZJD8_9TELE|nr:hypothetical protein P4O66_005734 [Electrophorus voltai]
MWDQWVTRLAVWLPTGTRPAVFEEWCAHPCVVYSLLRSAAWVIDVQRSTADPTEPGCRRERPGMPLDLWLLALAGINTHTLFLSTLLLAPRRDTSLQGLEQASQTRLELISGAEKGLPYAPICLQE